MGVANVCHTYEQSENGKANISHSNLSVICHMKELIKAQPLPILYISSEFNYNLDDWARLT